MVDLRADVGAEVGARLGAAGLRVKAGIFAALSRRQYGAVAAMRWEMLRHSLRTTQGKFEVGARIFTTSFFALMGLAMGSGLGFAAYSIVSEHSERYLPLVLWPVFFLWQVAPLVAASFQEHVDLSAFLRFPLGFGAYMLISLVFGLLDVSSILGWICLLGIGSGIAVARPAVVPIAFVALLLFGVFNLLLTRMIFSWIDRWLAQRRTREILGAAFLFLLLSFQLINPAIHHYRGHMPLVDAKRLLAVQEVQGYLPPGLAASAVRYTLWGRPLLAAGPLAGLAAYGAMAGLLLGLRLHAEYRGENLGEGAPQAIRLRSAGADTRTDTRTGIRGLSGPIGAVVEKELRYLSRSGVMLYSLAAPLVMLLIFGGNGMGMNSGTSVFARYALPVGVAYSFLGLTRLIYNSLGGDGAGIQFYFMSPTPLRRVMLAKNVVQAGLFCMELGLTCVVVRFRYGLPDGEMLAATLGWLLFALPVQLAAGNVLSLTMGYRMTMTRFSREEGAAGNGLMSLGIQVVLLGVGAAIFLPLARIGHARIAIAVFLLLAGGGAGLWLRVYAGLDQLGSSRKEGLIQKLARAA